MNFFTAVFLLIFAGLSGVSSLRAASAVKPIWKAQNNSLPEASGPGIVICEPATSPANPDASNFGAGCALWLQVVVGGQPQFGKTPLWGDLDRARTELKRPDLRISSAEAVDLAPILGVTHAAVGTLRGAEPHLTLTYRLLQVPSGTPVGAATTLTGTQAQIAAGLPQMAQAFAKRLGGSAPPTLSASTGLTPSDLQTLGQERWRKTVCSQAERAALEVMAAHSPVAGLINLNRHGGGYTAHYHTATETLLAQAGDNPLVWSVIMQRNNLMLVAHAAQLSALAARYPQNCTLEMVQALHYRLVQDHARELQAAEQATKDAPHSPGAWGTYGIIISSITGDERQGRVYDALSSSEAEYLGHLYAASEAAAHQAVQLDPSDAEAWESLAEDATFNSSAALADHAMQKALALSQDKTNVYDWALEMYQPKWDGDSVQLSKFAHMAAADATLGSNEVLHVAKELKSCGYSGLRTKMLTHFVANRRALLALHPGEGQTHFDLAAVLEATGDIPGALVEYQEAVKLLPENASAAYHLGFLLSTLYDQGQQTHRDQARLFIQKAVTLDPDLPEAYYALSDLESDGVSAEHDLQAAVRLDPAYGKAYGKLGNMAVAQQHLEEATHDYQSAIQYGEVGSSRDNYAYLVRIFAKTGQYEQVLTTADMGLSIYGDSMLYPYSYGEGNIYDDMARAYLHKKQWDKAIALCKLEFAYNADDPAAHENLAETYLGMNQIAQAQAEWKKVLTSDDDQEKALAEGFLKKYP